LMFASVKSVNEFEKFHVLQFSDDGSHFHLRLNILTTTATFNII
jgi:hypothetical protein